MLGPPHKSGYSDTRGAASRPPIVAEGGLEMCITYCAFLAPFELRKIKFRLSAFLSEYEDIPHGIKI